MSDYDAEERDALQRFVFPAGSWRSSHSLKGTNPEAASDGQDDGRNHAAAATSTTTSSPSDRKNSADENTPSRRHVPVAAATSPSEAAPAAERHSEMTQSTQGVSNSRSQLGVRSSLMVAHPPQPRPLPEGTGQSSNAAAAAARYPAVESEAMSVAPTPSAVGAKEDVDKEDVGDEGDAEDVSPAVATLRHRGSDDSAETSGFYYYFPEKTEDEIDNTGPYRHAQGGHVHQAPSSASMRAPQQSQLPQAGPFYHQQQQQQQYQRNMRMMAVQQQQQMRVQLAAARQYPPPLPQQQQNSASLRQMGGSFGGRPGSVRTQGGRPMAAPSMGGGLPSTHLPMARPGLLHQIVPGMAGPRAPGLGSRLPGAPNSLRHTGLTTSQPLASGGMISRARQAQAEREEAMHQSPSGYHEGDPAAHDMRATAVQPPGGGGAFSTSRMQNAGPFSFSAMEGSYMARGAGLSQHQADLYNASTAAMGTYGYSVGSAMASHGDVGGGNGSVSSVGAASSMYGGGATLPTADLNGAYGSQACLGSFVGTSLYDGDGGDDNDGYGGTASEQQRSGFRYTGVGGDVTTGSRQADPFGPGGLGDGSLYASQVALDSFYEKDNDFYADTDPTAQAGPMKHASPTSALVQSGAYGDGGYNYAAIESQSISTAAMSHGHGNAWQPTVFPQQATASLQKGGPQHVASAYPFFEVENYVTNDEGHYPNATTGGDNERGSSHTHVVALNDYRQGDHNSVDAALIWRTQSARSGGSTTSTGRHSVDRRLAGAQRWRTSGAYTQEPIKQRRRFRVPSLNPAALVEKMSG